MNSLPKDIVVAINTNDWEYLSTKDSEYLLQLPKIVKESLNTFRKSKDIRDKFKNRPLEITESDVNFAQKHFPKHEAKKIKATFAKKHYKQLFSFFVENIDNLGLSIENIQDIYLDYWHSGLYDKSWAELLSDIDTTLQKIMLEKAINAESDNAIVEFWFHHPLDNITEHQRNILDSVVYKLGTSITYKLIEIEINNNLHIPQYELSSLYEEISSSDLLESVIVREIIKGILNEQ